MTGRENSGGQSRGGQGYRGGRGRGRFQGGKLKGTSSKQLEMKFFPHGIGRDRQTVTYDTVKDHIVQYVQKTYNQGQDIAISLRDLAIKDLDPQQPRRGQATSTDAADKTNEQAGMDILYQAELERYLDRKATLEQNLHKSYYALIFSTYCNKMMQHRIEEHPDYETTIRDDYNAHDLETRLKNSITLDNGSMLSLFSNPDLVQDIPTTRTTLTLAMNTGVKKSNQEALVPEFGKVYFDKDTIANIFGLSDLKKKYWITYDSKNEEAFLVHKENKIIKSECSPEGL